MVTSPKANAWTDVAAPIRLNNIAPAATSRDPFWNMEVFIATPLSPLGRPSREAVLRPPGSLPPGTPPAVSGPAFDPSERCSSRSRSQNSGVIDVRRASCHYQGVGFLEM